MEVAELRILSLGAGVQSSTVALMAARGDIEPIDAAIFADTQAEPESVYNYLAYLEKEISQCEYPFPVFKTSAGSLAESSLRVRTSKKGTEYTWSMIPAFLINADGRKGLFGRHCTTEFKIKPIHRKTKELLGIKQFRAVEGLLCDMLIGISTDEIMRKKPSRVEAIRHVFPLLDLDMSRQDCIEWMSSRGYVEPPKSACLFCPFHSDQEWVELKSNPKEWEYIVQFEKDLQETQKKNELTGVPYLHRSGVPIGEVKFDVELNGLRPQVNMFGNECEGLCGV